MQDLIKGQKVILLHFESGQKIEGMKISLIIIHSDPIVLKIFVDTVSK